MSKQQRDAIDAALRARSFDTTEDTDQVRKSYEALRGGPLPEHVRSREGGLGGVGVLELSITSGAPIAAEPVVLYFHGGGYVIGSARTGARMAAELARRTGGRAVSVDYRLAPEHPYPAPVEDGVSAYAGLLESGADPRDIVVAGDSAGGGLAVATLLALRDRELPQPAAVAVFSPWVDLTRSGASMRSKDGADPLFNYDALGWFAERYMPAGDRSVPLASPAFAILTGLPPILIQVGSHEILTDDAIRLAASAARDDVDVALHVVAGVPHVFQNNFGQLDEADDALDEVAAFFRAHLR